MISFLRRGVFLLLKTVLRPFEGLRTMLIKGLLLAGVGRAPETSLRSLLGMRDFVDTLIDQECVAWGDGIHVKHELMDGIHSFFYTRIPSGSRVLDVGSGIGALAYAVVSHTDAQVIGVEFDAGHVEFAARRFQHPRLRFVHGDATRDLPGEAIDVIILSSVLEHVQDRVGLLHALVVTYHPRTLLVRVPGLERHYLVALKKRLGLFPYTDPDHKTEYTPQSFREEMQSAGLDIAYLETRWGDLWAECEPRATGREEGV